MDYIKYLKRVPIFTGLSSADLRKVLNIAKVKVFCASKSIFGEDTAGDRLYVVLSGRVKIFTSLGERKKTLAYLDAGEFFGEISLLDSRPRSASCNAIENCELLVISKNDFHQLLLRYPRMCLRVLETISRRLRQADSEIESLTFENVLGRVAGVLLKFGEKYGGQLGVNGSMCLDLTQKEISEIVGTSREVVSRIVNRFKRLGCVKYDGKLCFITDEKKLKQFVR